MIVASFVDAIESTGTYSASSSLGGLETPPLVLLEEEKRSQEGTALHIKLERLNYAIGLQGLGTLLDAVFGMGLGSSASKEFAGFMGLTEICSQNIVLVSTIFMLLFSVLGKFGVLFASIPLPIVAALYIVFFPYLVSTGLDDIKFCDLKSHGTKFVLGFSLFMALSAQKYFAGYDLFSGQPLPHTGSSWLNDVVQLIFSSPPTTATIIAFILDRIINKPSPKNILKDAVLETEPEPEPARMPESAQASMPLASPSLRRVGIALLISPRVMQALELEEEKRRMEEITKREVPKPKAPPKPEWKVPPAAPAEVPKPKPKPSPARALIVRKKSRMDKAYSRPKFRDLFS